MTKVMTIEDSTGNDKEIEPIVTSSGSQDEGLLVKTDSTGRFDLSVLPDSITGDLQNIETIDALVAGDYVNIFSDAGTAKARLADASDVSTKATGFVLDAFAASSTALVHLSGTNNEQSGLSPNNVYFLSETPGQPTLTPPTSTGTIEQILGTAINNSSIPLQISNPIINL